jgi:hypothetical protein
MFDTNRTSSLDILAIGQGYRPGAIELTGALLTMLALIGANLAGRRSIRRPAWAAARS